jgi:hypothetical protein
MKLFSKSSVYRLLKYRPAGFADLRLYARHAI